MSETRASTPDGPFYLAMGRFVVEFSQFVFFLQEGCILVAQQGHHDIQPQLRIATIQVRIVVALGVIYTPYAPSPLPGRVPARDRP
jgi:hypothetical protein